MLMRFQVEHPYDKPLTAEQVATLRTMVRNPEHVPDDGKVSWRTFEGDPMAVMSAIGCPVKVEPGHLGMTAMEAFLDRLSAIEKKLVAGHRPESFNARCDVHVPGLGLLLIDDVKVLENACTDELQDHLEEGWRIIAACPQPDQRRPDYVLGRSNAGTHD